MDESIGLVRSVADHREPPGTLILGSEATARKLCDELLHTKEPEKVRVVEYAELVRFARREDISRIIVADVDIEEGSAAAEALIDFKLRGVKIERAIESFEKTARKIWLQGLTSKSVIFANGYGPSKFYLGCKRTFDLIVSVVLFILTAPLMALIAAAIKLESPGPSVFKQERVGFQGKKFTVYKFRSMRQDAEKDTGPAWAKKDDDRVTRVGAILRKCRLDELPQIYNVIRGEMSFIGPRPERPYFVDLLKGKVPYYELRHYIKPGVTGWAQVMYPYGASVEDAYQKLQYDLYYAKHMSLSLDLSIVFRTLKVVCAGEGR
jgi:exopolysaccharide biosynthesis polyprenyl glycosylphosphotransferase